jgi:hypothetical protein
MHRFWDSVFGTIFETDLTRESGLVSEVKFKILVGQTDEMVFVGRWRLFR